MSSADEEVFTAQPQVVNDGNKTYVKTTKDANHPIYYDMVEEAITKLGGGRNGISKVKITEYINDKYKMEANNMFVKKALKKGLESNCYENKTGTGATGSFRLTKEFKDKLIAKEKAKAKKEKQILKEKESNEEGETKPKKKPSTSKSKGKSKDDMELEKVKEKASKKPPSGAKDKENKSTKSKPAKGAQKTLKEKVKTLKKSNSTGSMKKKIANSLPPDENEASNEPEPSTSKKRGAPKKTAAK